MKLYWTPDSPPCRIVKWFLLAQQIPHENVTLGWSDLRDKDRMRGLLGDVSPKLQVPCVRQTDNSGQADSLLICARLVEDSRAWLGSGDALLFRTMDVEGARAVHELYEETKQRKTAWAAETSRRVLVDLEHVRRALEFSQGDAVALTPGLIASHVMLTFLLFYLEKDLFTDDAELGHERSRLEALQSHLQQLTTAAPSYHSFASALAAAGAAIPPRGGDVTVRTVP